MLGLVNRFGLLSVLLVLFSAFTLFGNAGASSTVYQCGGTNVISAQVSGDTANILCANVIVSNSIIDVGQYSFVTFNGISNTANAMVLKANAILSSANVPLGASSNTYSVPVNTNGNFVINFNAMATSGQLWVTTNSIPSNVGTGGVTFVYFNTINSNLNTIVGGWAINVFVTNTPFTTTINSLMANTVNTVNAITVDPAPNLLLTGNTFQYGNALVVNALATQGTGTFTFAWSINSASATSRSIGSAASSNTLSLPATGTYAYSVAETDTGTSTPFTPAATTNTFTISKNASLSTATITFTQYSSAGTELATSTNPSTSTVGQYDYANFTFAGANTINNQASTWSLYVNGALYATNNFIRYSEQNNPGSYQLSFQNSGDNNYTNYTIGTTLKVNNAGGSTSTGGGGGGGTGYYSTVSSTVSTTTIATTAETTVAAATTTVAPSQQTVNVTTESYNSSLNVSASSSALINYTPAGYTVQISSGSSSPSTASVSIMNVTATAPAAPSNYTTLSAVNVNVSSKSSLGVNITAKYPCSANSSQIAPFVYNNGTWEVVSKFTVDAAACSVSFSITGDPIVAVMKHSGQSAPATTAPYTTAYTNATTVASQAPSSGISSTTAVEAVIVVIVILIIAYLALGRGRKGR